MKIKLSAVLSVLTISLFIFSSGIFAQDISIKKLSISENNNRGLIIEDKISAAKDNNILAPQKLHDLSAQYFSENKFQSAEDNMQVKKKKKSVGLGVLLSALIPGAGEFYGENYLKAGIFFGVEILAWATFAYFESKGNKKEDEYQAYADQYWDVRTYARWLKNEGFNESSGINPEEPNRDVLREQIMVCERANFSHTMPEYESQQYYELIGKYHQYSSGWNDFPENETNNDLISQNFTFYAGMRGEANDFYSVASTAVIGIYVNHFLSALDAVWSATQFNKDLAVKVRLENIQFADHAVFYPSVNFTYSF